MGYPSDVLKKFEDFIKLQKVALLFSKSWVVLQNWSRKLPEITNKKRINMISESYAVWFLSSKNVNDGAGSGQYVGLRSCTSFPLTRLRSLLSRKMTDDFIFARKWGQI